MENLILTMLSSGVILVGLVISMIYEGEKTRPLVGFVISGVGIALFYWYGLSAVNEGTQHKVKEIQERYEQDIEGLEKQKMQEEEMAQQVKEGVKTRIGTIGEGKVRLIGKGMYKVIYGDVVYDVWVEEDKIEAIVEGNTVLYKDGEICEENIKTDWIEE